MLTLRPAPAVPRDLRELEVAYAQVQPPPGPTAPQPARLPRPPGPSMTFGVRGDSPGAGQSSTALGLALAWASMGRTVLVVDLDPVEDLARLLHVGWALRPGNAHTIAHVVRTGSPLVPAPSLLAGITVASLGTMPGGHPAEVARAFARDRARLAHVLAATFGRHDRVVIDLPQAAALEPLGALAGRRLTVRGGEVGARRLGFGSRHWDLPAGVGDLWSLVDGSVGVEVDEAFRHIAGMVEGEEVSG